MRVWRPDQPIATSHSFLVGHAPSGTTAVLGHLNIDLPDPVADGASDASQTLAEKARTSVWAMRSGIETELTASSLGTVRKRNPLHTEIVTVCNDCRKAAEAAGNTGTASSWVELSRGKRAVQYLFAPRDAAVAALAEENRVDTSRRRLRRLRGLPMPEAAAATSTREDEDDHAADAVAGSGVTSEQAAGQTDDGARASARSDEDSFGPPRTLRTEAEEQETPGHAVIFRDETDSLCVLVVPACLVGPK